MGDTIIVKFQSRVFLRQTRTYLLVGQGEKYNHFLTMETGMIDIKRVPKVSMLMKELSPYNKYSLKHAAQIYSQTTLEKSSKAKRILKIILANRDENRTNFLPTQEREKLERPTKAERTIEKANEITLEHLCQEMRLDPKKIRFLFREAGIKKPGARWTWEKSQRDKIVKMIQSLDI